MTWILSIGIALLLGYVVAPQLEPGLPRAAVHALAALTVLVGPIILRMLVGSKAPRG